MSIFKNKIPDGSVVMARSSVIYTLNQTPKPTTLVAYDLKIWVWRGSITSNTGAELYKLRRYPDANENAVFDISKLLQGYFIDLDYNLPDETTGNLVINFQIEGSWYDGRISHDAELTGINQAHFGFNYFTDSVNQIIPQNNGGFLTDLPSELNMPKNGYMSLFTRNTIAPEVSGYKIVADGGVVENIAFTTGTPTLSEQTVLRFGIGYAELPLTIAANTTNYYEVTLTYRTDVGRTIRFNILDYCKYEKHGIDFINKYGVWDRIYMYGRTIDKLTVKGNDAMRYSIYNPDHTDTWKQGDGQFVKFNKNGLWTKTLNTGWVSDEINESMEQLYLAERVVVDGHSAILIPNSFERKIGKLDKMINYSMDIQFAFTKINTVG